MHQEDIGYQDDHGSNSGESDRDYDYEALIANIEQAVRLKTEKEEKTISKEMKERLSKRLMYLLRYGAVREGLTVHPGGFVDLKSLLTVPLMKRSSKDEVLALLDDDDVLFRGTSRFEKKITNGATYIKAKHGQHMERSPYHDGTKVPRLLSRCMDHICSHLTDYDFEGFPDSYMLNALVHYLKTNRLLSNAKLRMVLNPSIEHLDLEGMYVTEASVRIIGNKCPDLQVLSLRGCGYALTDLYMELLFNKLQKLKSLNISGCQHLTDRTIDALCKSNPGLVHLCASGNRHFSERAILNIVLKCTHLEHLDIYDNPNITASGRENLVQIGKQRKLTVVQKDLIDKTVAPEDPSVFLSVWRSWKF